MTHAGNRSTCKQRSLKRRITIHEGLYTRIGALLIERDELREEIRQLNASVQIYGEIVRRLESERRALRAA